MKYLAILIIQLIALQSCSSNKVQSMEDEMKIISIPWSIITRVPITEESIWTITESDTITINDEVYINDVLSKLSKLKEANEYNGIDVRVSVVISTFNDKIDTLSFGKNKIIKWNDIYYEWKDSLFLKIVNKLSNDHKKNIDEYLYEE
jgi:hypothetical protein